MRGGGAGAVPRVHRARRARRRAAWCRRRRRRARRTGRGRRRRGARRSSSAGRSAGRSADSRATPAPGSSAAARRAPYASAGLSPASGSSSTTRAPAARTAAAAVRVVGHDQHPVDGVGGDGRGHRVQRQRQGERGMIRPRPAGRDSRDLATTSRLTGTTTDHRTPSQVSRPGPTAPPPPPSSEREGAQRERGARRAGRPALAPAGLSEERTQPGGRPRMSPPPG